MTCPKCGIGRFDGPRYLRSSETGAECLLYACTTCGYSKETLTRDAEYALARQQRIMADFMREQAHGPIKEWDKPMKDITPRPKQIEAKK